MLPPKQTRSAEDFVATPMPGTLVSLAVKEGDVVVEGQEVAVVEAMKMQNSLAAPRSGKVKKVYFKVCHKQEDGARRINEDWQLTDGLAT